MTLEIITSGNHKCGICKRPNLPMIMIDGNKSCHFCISKMHRILSSQKTIMYTKNQIEEAISIRNLIPTPDGKGWYTGPVDLSKLKVAKK